MAWFRVDDTFHSSRKVKAIPRGQRLAAIGLWTLAGTWSAQEEQDGKVPAYIVEDFAGERAATELVKVGLWDKTDEGFRFHDWTDYQPTRAQLEERREKERQRIAEKRAKRTDVASNTDATPEQVGSVLRSPDPTRPDPLTYVLEGASPKQSTASLSPFCSKHPNGTDDNCRACGRARMAWELAGRPQSGTPAKRDCQTDSHKPHPADPTTCVACGERIEVAA